jgi:hypothetical protein
MSVLTKDNGSFDFCDKVILNRVRVAYLRLRQPREK